MNGGSIGAQAGANPVQNPYGVAIITGRPQMEGPAIAETTTGPMNARQCNWSCDDMGAHYPRKICKTPESARGAS